MSLKTRILFILSIASIASAGVTGVVLIFLVQLHGQIIFKNNSGSIIMVLAIAVSLIGGLLIIGLLNLLLNKVAIIPAMERERLENEHTMLSDQLHHSQKMEAVGRLAGSIAHDFNNLLTIVDGYASLIISNPTANETEQSAKEIVEAARKASFITRKLLSFSHKEKTEPVILDLNTTLTDTDKMLSRLIGEKVELITHPSSEPLFVKVDPVELGQVLMNLAVNARDAMPNGGRITIKIDGHEVEEGEHVRPIELAAGRYAKISVRDTGMGIEPEKMDQIFEPFFTTKSADKGTGLGLSIVRDIIKKAGGVIDLISKHGGGTTFFIYLPVVDVSEEVNSIVVEPPVNLMNKTTANLRVEGEVQTILLVEDDQMIRTLVSHTLELQNYKVLLAEDGWEAAQNARKYDGKIDLLFTDVIMPGLGGGELALAIRELYPEIKVLFMSGYSRSQVIEEGVPADAMLLEKPFTPDKVISVVRDLLAR